MFIKKFSSVITLLLALAYAEIAAAETETPDSRLAISTINGQVLHNEHRLVPRTENSLQQIRSTLHANHGLWIYDFLIDLSIDNDADGHYSRFSITLDLDNSLSPREVYVVFYLSQNHGPWFEYAATGDFTVSGSSSIDAISVETTLDSGYPSDYYDLYAEVYDSYSGDLLITFGPGDSTYVIDIPFESHHDDSYFSSDVSVELSFSGSGSLPPASLLFLLCLFGFQAFRITRQT